MGWRRERDSNPRYPCEYNGFRDRPIQPLWHLSNNAKERKILTSFATRSSDLNEKKAEGKISLGRIGLSNQKNAGRSKGLCWRRERDWLRRSWEGEVSTNAVARRLTRRRHFSSLHTAKRAWRAARIKMPPDGGNRIGWRRKVDSNADDPVGIAATGGSPRPSIPLRV